MKEPSLSERKEASPRKLDDKVEYGHCGIYCPNWICTVEGKGLDDLCTGCPCYEDEEEEEYEGDEMGE